MKLYTMPGWLRIFDRTAVYELSGPGNAALTFDDGPDPEYTPRILDRLGALGVPATFFVLGAQARRSPALVRRIAEEGHAVGLHGYDHRQTAAGRTARITEGMLEAARIVADITGRRPCLYRPPYGRMKRAARRVLDERGFKRILWSVMPCDFLHTDPAMIVGITGTYLRPGSIVCLHDGGGDRSATVDALEGIVGGVPQGITWTVVPEHCP